MMKALLGLKKCLVGNGGLTSSGMLAGLAIASRILRATSPYCPVWSAGWTPSGSQVKWETENLYWFRQQPPKHDLMHRCLWPLEEDETPTIIIIYARTENPPMLSNIRDRAPSQSRSVRCSDASHQCKPNASKPIHQSKQLSRLISSCPDTVEQRDQIPNPTQFSLQLFLLDSKASLHLGRGICLFVPCVSLLHPSGIWAECCILPPRLQLYESSTLLLQFRQLLLLCPQLSSDLLGKWFLGVRHRCSTSTITLFVAQKKVSSIII